MHAVFGNNDGDRVMLVRRGEGFCEFHDGCAILELDGRKIAMTHYPDLAPALLASGMFDLVIHGHDHRVRVEGGRAVPAEPGHLLGIRRPPGHGRRGRHRGPLRRADRAVEGVLDRPVALFYKQIGVLKVAVRTADNRD